MSATAWETIWCRITSRGARQGTFYGWPWYYISGNEDPHHFGQRPDLKDKVTIPDVLLQPHFAALGLTFYEKNAFPTEYSGDGFAGRARLMEPVQTHRP